MSNQVGRFLSCRDCWEENLVLDQIAMPMFLVVVTEWFRDSRKPSTPALSRYAKYKPAVPNST